MITATYIIRVDQASVKNISEILNYITNRTQFKSGCLISTLWRSEDGSEFMQFEIWHSKSDLEKHIGSELYKRLFAALEMGIEKPVIRFLECENARGMDMIEEILMQNAERAGNYR